MASLLAENEVEVDYYCLGEDHPHYPNEVRVLKQLRAAAKSEKLLLADWMGLGLGSRA
jgi:hypothetical protein